MSDKNETVDNDGEDLAAIVADLKAQVTKLSNKNRELLGEKQSAKQAAQEAADAAEQARLEAATKTGDIDAIRSAAAKEAKKWQDQYNEMVAKQKASDLNSAIANGLTANNVRPELAKAVTALMKAEADFVDGQPMIQGQPISDYMKSYLTSKEGAHFVRAADNSGGGAMGSGNTSTARMTKENWNWSEYGKQYAENPEQAKAMAAAAGVKVPE